MLDDLDVFAKVEEEKQLIEYPWMIREDQANNNNNSIIIVISFADGHRKQNEKNTETDIIPSLFSWTIDASTMPRSPCPPFLSSSFEICI